MTDEQKLIIVANVKNLLPGADESRLSALLNLIVLEIDASNSCAADVKWDKLCDVVAEILYQTMKSEMDSGVSSVKRGDTTIAYVSGAHSTQSLIAGYHNLIDRILGCSDGLEFF
ncbi:hypothetical protein ACWOB3_07715 [Enterococcus songbeiensis]